MSTFTGLLASKYAINKPTTTSSPAENMANITSSSSKKSRADMWDEDSEESTTSGQDSNNTTDCESTSSSKQPASKKPCEGMLKSRWADANYECKGAQTRAEYRATNGTTTITTKQSPSKNKLSTSTNKPAAKESTDKWDTPTYYGSTTTTTKQPVGMLKSRWSTTTKQPTTTTTTTSSSSSTSSSSTSSSPTTSSTTTKTTTPPTPTESKQPVDDKPAPGMIKSHWADDTHEYKSCQTRAEYRATHKTTNNNKPRRR